MVVGITSTGSEHRLTRYVRSKGWRELVMLAAQQNTPNVSKHKFFDKYACFHFSCLQQCPFNEHRPLYLPLLVLPAVHLLLQFPALLVSSPIVSPTILADPLADFQGRGLAIHR